GRQSRVAGRSGWWRTRCARTAAGSARPHPEEVEELPHPGRVTAGGQAEDAARGQDQLHRRRGDRLGDVNRHELWGGSVAQPALPGVEGGGREGGGGGKSGDGGGGGGRVREGRRGRV